MLASSCFFSKYYFHLQKRLDTMDNISIDRLKEIVNGSYRRISNEDRAYVYECADSLGIEHKKTTCKSCVIDIAILCINELRKGEDVTGTGMRLKEGVDILVNGTRINAATCSTKEECEAAIAMGTPKHYFDFD